MLKKKKNGYITLLTYLLRIKVARSTIGSSEVGKFGDGPKERAKPPKAVLLVGCYQYILFGISGIYLLFTV